MFTWRTSSFSSSNKRTRSIRCNWSRCWACYYILIGMIHDLANRLVIILICFTARTSRNGCLPLSPSDHYTSPSTSFVTIYPCGSRNKARHDPFNKLPRTASTSLLVRECVYVSSQGFLHGPCSAHFEGKRGMNPKVCIHGRTAIWWSSAGKFKLEAPPRSERIWSARKADSFPPTCLPDHVPTQARDPTMTLFMKMNMNMKATIEWGPWRRLPTT